MISEVTNAMKRPRSPVGTANCRMLKACEWRRLPYKAQAGVQVSHSLALRSSIALVSSVEVIDLVTQWCHKFGRGPALSGRRQTPGMSRVCIKFSDLS